LFPCNTTKQFNNRYKWQGYKETLSPFTPRACLSPGSRMPATQHRSPAAQQPSYAAGSCLPDSNKPLALVAWVLTRYTLVACYLLSCWDLRLSCLSCLSRFVLGSCFAGTPVGPPDGCLPIQLLGGNGGGTPFMGRCCGNSPVWNRISK
jgi:hypothetical protein